MIFVQMCRQIFCQTIQIEEARVIPMPTKFVKYNGKEASKYARLSCAPGDVIL